MSTAIHEIVLHESAKQAFDKLGGKEPRKRNCTRNIVRPEDMTDLGAARQNIERLLNIRQPNEKSRDTQR